MRLIPVLVVMVCAVPRLAAAQPVTGPYVNLGLGLDFLQNESLTPDDATAPLARSDKFDPGFAASASVGYGRGNGVRVEIEGDYANNRVHGVQFSLPARAGGNQQQFGGFLNGFYDFDLSLPVFPYLGAGLGYQEIELDRVNSSLAGVPVRPGPAEYGGAFAYQGIAGLSYPLGMMPGLSVTAEYRLLGVLSPPPYDRNGGASTLSNIFNQEALVGLRYAFNNAPPAAPPAEAATPPAPAPARTYLVFFDWDRADLTDRSRQIIAEAAQASTRVQTTRIQVNGYTDLSGAPAYNQQLSMRRAETVAGELVRDGVPRAVISIQGFGESNPLVPTNKGVKEPQNRRVEIIIN
jgi:outer membrane protein OmpA-like peptidoglycan-associated protein